MTVPPKELLDTIRRAQDAAMAPSEADELARARAGFLEAAGAQGRAPTRMRWHGWGVAAVLAAAVGLLWYGLQEAPLTFEVNGDRGEVGAWIEADGAFTRLQFSDATSFDLEPSATARVLRAEDGEAEVLIEQGVAQVRVTPGQQRTWRVMVGPFEVRVVGTIFDVRWDAAERRFELELQHGEVRVEGPLLDDGRSVYEGERLVVDLRERRAQLFAEPGATAGPDSVESSASPAAGTAPSAPDEPLPSPLDPTPLDGETRTDPEPESSPTLVGTDDGEIDQGVARLESRGRPSTSAPVAPLRPDETAAELDEPALDWEALAREGRYVDAVRAADSEALLRLGSANELIRLGDAARLAGRRELAGRAYSGVRERFGGRQAAMAAFSLGRLAIEGGAGPAVAAAWFERYLEEDPAGPLGREAAGRLIEAHRRAGNSSATVRAAENYLAQDPDGPHAELAQSVLSR